MNVLVIGAGIFGVTAALEMRRRAHEVTLCDPGPVPHPLAESTDISKVVRMDYADEFYRDLMDETFAGWRAWNRRWGEDLYHEVGFLVLSRTAMQPGGFEDASFRGMGRRGHAVERLNGGEIARRFPAWADGVYGDGYFNPIGGWVESARVVERLAADARSAGVSLRPDTRVGGLAEDGRRVCGAVTESGERLPADVVLVAAGSWTPVLLPHLRDRLWSTAQTVLLFRTAEVAAYQPPRFPVWAAAIGSEGWYGFPALADGTVKIANHGPGRPLHPDGDRALPAGEEERFREFLRGALPGLAEAPLAGSRVCLYSDSADGDFHIDHDPDRPGLVVATGGSGHAFKFAPALGTIIADVIEHRPNRWADRFRWRRGQGDGRRK